MTPSRVDRILALFATFGLLYVAMRAIDAGLQGDSGFLVAGVVFFVLSFGAARIASA